MVKNTSVIIVFSVAIIFFTGIDAFAHNYLNHGSRDSFTHNEKIALVHDEYRELNRPGLEKMVKRLDEVSRYIDPDKKGAGSVRVDLTGSERVNLIMEEDKHLMFHHLPAVRRRADEPQAVFNPVKEYVHGKCS